MLLSGIQQLGYKDGRLENWDDLKVMLALSRYGTMTAAARSLDMSTATVSRRLERCTEQAGRTLFVRRGNTLVATPAAEGFLALAEAVAEGFHADGKLPPTEELGIRVLRASMPLDLCMDTVSAHIPNFLRENPRLTLDIIHEEKSIAFGEVDIRVSYNEPLEGRLVRLRLGAVGFRNYIGKADAEVADGWVEILSSDRKSTEMGQAMRNQFGPPRFMTTSISCAIRLVQEMPFSVTLPTRLAANYPELTPSTLEADTRYLSVWAAYHESRRLDQDVRLSLSFLKNCFDP